MSRATAHKVRPVEVVLPEFGELRMSDLGPRQCRFACTPHDAPSHRFCGRPTAIGTGNRFGSWCDQHLPKIWSEGRIGPLVDSGRKRRPL